MSTLTDAVNTLVSNTTTLQTTVSGRITDMDGKITQADTAKVAAEAAKAAAEIAKSGADTAKTDAETAKTLAESAKAAAETAQGIAATAKTDALLAKSASETAKDNAVVAQTASESAKTNAQDWASKTTGAVAGGEYSAKYHATAASGSATTAASTLSDRYTKAETDSKIVELAPATDISGKVDKVSWNHSGGSLGSFTEDASIGTIQVGAVSGVDGSSMTATSSDIPTGLTLASSGALTGTLPNITTTASSSFTVSVTDGVNTNSRVYSITNSADNDTPVWTTAAGALTIATSTYSEQLVATDPEGSGVTYTLQSGALPSGLSLSSSGLISGTATPDGSTYNFTVRVSDTVNFSDRSFSIMTGVLTKNYYSYGASSGYTGGWTDTTVVAASTNYVTYNSNNFYLYNVGSSGTWMGIHTRLHSSGTFAIPSYHDKLKMYVWIEVKDSNNNDTGGSIYVGLGSSQQGSEYSFTSLNGQIGNNDNFNTTLSLDIPASARGQNVYYTIGSDGGQYCNVRFYLYTIVSYIG